MKDKLTKEMREELLQKVSEGTQAKGQLLLDLIKNDPHVAEINTHLDWMHACITGTVLCALTSVTLLDDLKFSDKEKMLLISEENIKDLIRCKFAQAHKELWKDCGGS